MDKEELDLSMQLQPFGTKDAIRAQAQMRRRIMLGLALWGRTSADLQRQLLAFIPAGYGSQEVRSGSCGSVKSEWRRRVR
jgi:hypothetical protein